MFPVDSVSGPPMSTPLPVLEVDLGRLVDGSHHQPHGILGPHIHDGSVTVRVLRPLADSVTVITPEGPVALRHEYRGIWCGVIESPDLVDTLFKAELSKSTSLDTGKLVGHNVIFSAATSVSVVGN